MWQQYDKLKWLICYFLKWHGSSMIYCASQCSRRFSGTKLSSHTLIHFNASAVWMPELALTQCKTKYMYDDLFWTCIIILPCFYCQINCLFENPGLTITQPSFVCVGKLYHVFAYVLFNIIIMKLNLLKANTRSI